VNLSNCYKGSFNSEVNTNYSATLRKLRNAGDAQFSDAS